MTHYVSVVLVFVAAATAVTLDLYCSVDVLAIVWPRQCGGRTPRQETSAISVSGNSKQLT